MFDIDGIGLVATGAAASLLFLGMYLLRERKDDAVGGVAIGFVICVCIAYSRIFATIPHQ